MSTTTSTIPSVNLLPYHEARKAARRKEGLFAPGRRGELPGRSSC